MSALEVVATGPLALVQDEGRPGLAALGVGRSGAADRRAYRLANRLLANLDGAAALEVLLGGLDVVARGTVTVVVTGADLDVTVDGRPAGTHAPVTLHDGARLALGTARAGLRAYVGVRGGIVVDPVLGSRSTDTLSGVGPPALAVGDVLPVGPSPWGQPPLDVAPVAAPPTGTVTLRARRGPRDAWLADADALVLTSWTASDRSDRVGLRLGAGDAPLRLADPDRQLPSEGAVRGAVQVPPSGEPVVFLADHPVTGGYPVAAVLLDEDVDCAAQVRPGQAVRLRWA